MILTYRKFTQVPPALVLTCPHYFSAKSNVTIAQLSAH